MVKSIFFFAVRLLLWTSGLFLLHILALHLTGKTLLENFIFTSYIFNFIITIIFFSFLLISSKFNDSSLGWVFFITSGLKFLAFFIIIYPFFNLDNIIQKIELLNFFIPYTICLTIEIRELSKILNSAWLNRIQLYFFH